MTVGPGWGGGEFEGTGEELGEFQGQSGKKVGLLTPALTCLTLGSGLGSAGAIQGSWILVPVGFCAVRHLRSKAPLCGGQPQVPSQSLLLSLAVSPEATLA